MSLSQLAIAGLMLGVVVALALAFGGENNAASKRARALKAGGSAPRAKQPAAADSSSKRRQAHIEALKELGDREKEARKSRLSIGGRLRQANLSISEPTFWIASAALGLIVGGASWLAEAPPLVALGSGVSAAFGAPRWALGFLIKRRQKIFVDQFADGIDVIVRGVKSGLPLNQCMQIVANESADPLKREFQALVDGQSMGVPLAQNIQRFYERMPLPEVNFFGIVLIIQQKTGGNLSESLQNLSTVLRSRKLLKEKIKALSAEAKASAAIIACLPVLVAVLVYFSRPDYIMLLFQRPEGQAVLIGSAAMMAMGISVMKRMVDFKY